MLLRSSAPVLQDPRIGICDHVDQFADDVVIGLVQFLPNLLGKIATLNSKVEPGLDLSRLGLGIVELAYKGRLVPPFRHASAMLLHTARDDRRIWSVSEYVSSRGNCFVRAKILIAAWKASL
jgi:hypothetical protein